MGRAFVFGMLVVTGCCLGSWSTAQIVKTAPDLKPSPGFRPGTGVDRNGIMHRPSTGRTNTYVIPQGGYYYGWSPYGSYYGGSSYYYRGYAVCPYCGSRWCNGNCRYNGGTYYLPPVAADAGQLYGPRAARNFLGIDNQNNNANTGRTSTGQGGVAAAPELPPPVSNPTTRAQAWKFVEYGDRNFKKGNYRQALDRYKKAESQAPDIAEIQFRKAFAELGVSHYSEAVSAIRAGLSLKPDWPESGFVLEELYPTAEAKREIFRQLHTELNEHPNDADALFMLSVMQHFDGQEAAAEVGFRRVVELTGMGNHARAFLPVTEVAQVPAEPAPPEGDIVNE